MLHVSLARCLYCRLPLREESLSLCRVCATPYHSRCSTELEECAVFGCRGIRFRFIGLVDDDEIPMPAGEAGAPRRRHQGRPRERRRGSEPDLSPPRPTRGPWLASIAWHAVLILVLCTGRWLPGGESKGDTPSEPTYVPLSEADDYVRCPVCKGPDREIPTRMCGSCRGLGYVHIGQRPCAYCRGTGETSFDSECLPCFGSGIEVSSNGFETIDRSGRDR